MFDPAFSDAAYFVFFAGVILAYMIAVSAVVMRIRERHVALWTALGRPSTWEGNPLTVIRYLGFIFSARHKKTEDILLSFYIWVARFMLILSVFLLLGSIWFK